MLVMHLSAEIKDADVPENFAETQLDFFKIWPPFRIFVPAVSYQHAQLSRCVKAQPDRQRGFDGAFILSTQLGFGPSR